MGLIIGIGIIVDLFVVFFECIKDEICEGCLFWLVVLCGWVCVCKMIVLGNVVIFLVVVVLYFLVIG